MKGTPQAAIPFAQLAMTAHMAPDMLPEGMGPGLEAIARYRPPQQFTWSNATHGCVVEVDPRRASSTSALRGLGGLPGR